MKDCSEFGFKTGPTERKGLYAVSKVNSSEPQRSPSQHHCRNQLKSYNPNINYRAIQNDYLLYSENIYVGNGFGNGYVATTGSQTEV
eukprot:4261741-Amphidinium_carterae.1